MSKNRTSREQKTIEKMIAMYCRDNHGTQELCPACTELQSYAMDRIYRCKFGDNKTSCGKCPVQCYRKDMRDKIIEVMRYAGPRILFHHPVLAVYHLLDSLKKTHKAYDTIIFDLDGTLLNTLEDLTDSVNFALKLYGFPSRKIAEVRSFVGNGVARLMELSIPDGLNNPQYGKCLADFRNHYSGNMQNKTDAFEGVMELLGKLSKEDYKIAIVSNKFDKAVKELNQVYFGEYIKVALGESENISKKPAPDIVFKALEELGSTADKALYVGDSDVDVETAKNSGIMCVGVTWGFRDREVLEQKGADYIIDTPQELLKILLVRPGK